VREYSPKRRTAVVFTGIGTTGAYHAGVLRALDESGVKIDLVVGSGVGAITAAFAAVGGGAKLYGRGACGTELASRASTGCGRRSTSR
jgi:predicted acylesterase/phospholipase RssA